MRKKYKIISITNIVLLISSVLIYRYSEVFRGQNPLYASLKMTGLGLLGTSVLWSFINTLYILFENKNSWQKYILWILISLLPFLIISIVLIIIFQNSI
jgi:hypothetical protein